ncbi:MAG TPA: ankyrin repeat domain-containing protein, partial [Terrimicrobiaceae bacterium]|nr:ankyrin repeat domain-containing protein [Terrimicrobiaceae bacterium]
MSARPFVRHSRLPLFRPGDESVIDGESSAEAFLRLACLNYGADHPSRRDQARAVIAGHPEIRGSNVFVAAAMGDAAALSGILQKHPESAGANGGPFGWEPLLYLAYSRCGFSDAWHDPVASARLLLQHGADPNAAFLWDGKCLFTALTGVFGEGEAGPVNQPAHSHEDSLARMLLAAGADPNDGQALYNRQFTRGSSHLRLLLDHGLGSASRGPGHERLGGPRPSPEDLLRGQLFWAAEHGHSDRVELLAARRVDLNAKDSFGRTASELAAINNHHDIVRSLERHGADPVSLSPAGQLEAACQAGRRSEAQALL